jgi:hypothetical protein
MLAAEALRVVVVFVVAVVTVTETGLDVETLNVLFPA